MKRSLINHIGLKALIVALVLVFSASPNVKAAYCTLTNNYQYLGYGMRINMMQFDGNTILKWDAQRDSKGNLVNGGATNPANSANPFWRDIDANNPVIKAKAGTNYTIRIYGGALYVYTGGSVTPENVSLSGNYPQDYGVYIDLNQDGSFATSERVGYSFSGSFDRSFTVSIPAGTKGGKTTMRIVCDYYGNSGSYIGPCSTYYGEARDFAIVIGGVDCGITKISSPSSPLSVGTQAVKAILKNYSEGDVLKSCIIDWTVDGVKQTAVNWTGSLGIGQEMEVTLGNYNFASKGNLTMYSVAATTSKPNNEDDANVLNDASPNLTLAMPLPAQAYYVGGLNPDFATLKEFTTIVALAGIKTDGLVDVRIRPGTYTGPFTLDNFPHKNNSFIFQSDPAFSGNVITTAPSTSLNYVWYLNNTQNVTFKGITFEVTDPSSLGGRIFMIRGNVDNLAFDNNTFNGLNSIGTTPKYTLLDCQASQMNNVRVYKNIFNNGDRSLSLVNTLRNSKGLTVEQNTFNSALNYGIYVENMGDGNILNNAVKGSSRASLGGIFVKNGTVITNNSITGIVGASTSAAGITIVDDNLAVSAVVTGNKITGCQGVNGISGTGLPGGTIMNNTIDLTNKNLNSAVSGILLSNPTLGTNKVIISENNILTENSFGISVVNFPIDILKNRIITDYNGSKVNLSSINTSGAKGMILSNEIISAGSAFTLANSTMTAAYNSAMCSGTANTLILNSGDNKIARNHLINLGTGNAFAITALNTNKLDGNNYITTTGILGSIDGTNYGSTTQFATFDKNAVSVDPTFKTNTNLKIIEFKDELNFTQPLANIIWPAGYQALYEEVDMAGVNREGKYYIGAYIVLPNLEIIGFSDELVDCSGTPDRSISVSAATSNGQEPTYQWFKDGLAIQDENRHILSFEPFDYSVSATYTCRVYCPGAGAKLTGTIPVYALTLPSIVEQPKEVVNAVIGKDYSFNVRVHYRGINPPYYKDNFQWFKYDAAKKD
ncbi:MAG: GEVED domain-containing protein, partial [Bacteroidota bacterium]